MAPNHDFLNYSSLSTTLHNFTKSGKRLSSPFPEDKLGKKVQKSSDYVEWGEETSLQLQCKAT